MSDMIVPLVTIAFFFFSYGFYGFGFFGFGKMKNRMNRRRS